MTQQRPTHFLYLDPAPEADAAAGFSGRLFVFDVAGESMHTTWHSMGNGTFYTMSRYADPYVRVLAGKAIREGLPGWAGQHLTQKVLDLGQLGGAPRQ
jgi:hypothetical protein